MATPKRFIAGAICPRCAAMDRIRTWEQQGVLYRECVACDFLEQLPVEEQATDPIETRVTRPREDNPNEDFQPVRILDPKGPTRH